MKVKYILILLFITAYPIFSSINYLSLGFSYNNFDLFKTQSFKGGCFSISGYNLSDNFIYGGFGEYLFSENLYLGKGGAIIGYGYTKNGYINYLILGKIGLGGGSVYSTNGATFEYGVEVNLIIIKSQSVSIFAGYEQIKNLVGVTALGSNGLHNVMIGIKMLFNNRN